MREAELKDGSPVTPGWFVVNVADAAWKESARFGRYCDFEGQERFPAFGINVHVLQPGQAACMYHRENQQEDFLVLVGECLVVIEDEERHLRAWDFVHCPAGATHVFVGAGDGPSAILMVGQRSGKEELVYPVSPAAARHAACVDEETLNPKEAYAGVAPPTPIPSPWPLATS